MNSSFTRIRTESDSQLDTAPVVIADGNGFEGAVTPPRPFLETSRAALSALPLHLHEGLTQSHLPALDGLRMVAAFLVLYHVDSRIDVGGHGVLSFFVLSGFRITWLLLWGEALSAFAYVSNYYHAILGDPDTGYSHTWSLAIEEQLYVLWPVSFSWWDASWRSCCGAVGSRACGLGCARRRCPWLFWDCW